MCTSYRRGGRSCFGTSDVVSEHVWVGRVQRDSRCSDLLEV